MNEFEFKKLADDMMSEISSLRLEIHQLKGAITTGTLSEKLLNMQEACKYLHISRATMYKRLADGDIAFAVKKGKSWLFPADKLKCYASGL